MTCLILAAAAAPALAQPWDVHDMSRPLPPHVEASCVSTPAPSDAIVLLGDDLSAWRTGDGDAAWRVEDGVATVQGGGITTRASFGDVQLHLEWMAPASEAGDEGQARGNSGVFLMERYEIQILESKGSTTYADGMAASLYGQRPPLVNAGAGVGEWQSYDIIFRAPVFDGEALVRPAMVTVLHNGVLVQDNAAFEGPTRHKQRTSYTAHAPTGAISLQDHGDPMRFRNIWVRPLAAEDGAM